MRNEIKTFRELVFENSDILTDRECKTGGRCGDPCQIWSMRRGDYACKPVPADKKGYYLCKMTDCNMATHLGKADWKNANDFFEDPICHQLSCGDAYLISDNFDKDKSSDVCSECDRPIEYANRRQDAIFTFRQSVEGDYAACMCATDRFSFRSLGQCKKNTTMRQWKEIFNDEG